MGILVPKHACSPKIMPRMHHALTGQIDRLDLIIEVKRWWPVPCWPRNTARKVQGFQVCIDQLLQE